MARRDDLYKEFIAAASKAYGEAIVSNEPNVRNSLRSTHDQQDAGAVLAANRRCAEKICA